MKTSTVKTQTYLQPTLGRDNDPRGEHSATVNVLQSEPVKLLPTRSDAGERTLPRAAGKKAGPRCISR
jgi:hypothetical protein